MTQRRDEDGKYWDTWDGHSVWGMIPAAAWETATVEDVTDEGGGVGEFLRALRQRQNLQDTLEFCQFSVRPRDRFEWFQDGSLWSPVPPSRFAPIFLAYPAVTKRLAAVLDQPNLSLLGKFQYASPLALDGLLAAQLVAGGPYSSHCDFRHTRAKELGAGFCATLFGGRYEDVQVAHANFPWSRWFCDLGWDQTWVVIDKRERRVTVLCTSDAD